MNENNEFGTRLKSIRINKKLSQEELAFMCNMQASHIGQIERGQKNPTLDTLIKISNGLDIPLPKLLDFENGIDNKEQNIYINKINACLRKLDEKEQAHILAIVKTFIDKTS